MNVNQLMNWLTKHEGIRKFPYFDPVGALTIGVGRNLDANGLSQDEIFYLLENDVKRCLNDLEQHAWYRMQPQIVKDALVNMCFNLGITGLLKFKNMINALAEKNYNLAADEALDSKWATQVKGRAIEIAKIIRSAHK